MGFIDKFIQNIRISSRIYLLVGLLLTSLIGLAIFVTVLLGRDIDFTQQELKGLEYIQALHPLFSRYPDAPRFSSPLFLLLAKEISQI